MYLKIYIHLPPFAINDRPESSRSPDPQRLSSLITTTLPSPRGCNGSTWFHLSNGDQAIKGEVPSNNWELAMLLRKNTVVSMIFIDFLWLWQESGWFFCLRSTCWQDPRNEFLGDVTWKNGLYWLVNWGSIGGQLGVIVLAKMRVPASTRSKGGIGRVLLHWLS